MCPQEQMCPQERTARIAELEADNARLRRLLDGGAAPAELRHRLRGTLGLLRGIIRQSAEAREDVAGYVAHLEDRLDAVARAQAAADRSHEVDLHGLLAGELFAYLVREGEGLRLGGPPILLQPRAAQVLGLAFHELAVNAVEHGPLGHRGGRVSASWSVDRAAPDPVLTLDWAEAGATGPAAPARKGFGTAVLTEMLRYELGCETTLRHAPAGLRCRLRFPLPARVGRVGQEPGRA